MARVRVVRRRRVDTKQGGTGMRGVTPGRRGRGRTKAGGPVVWPWVAAVGTVGLLAACSSGAPAPATTTPAGTVTSASSSTTSAGSATTSAAAAACVKDPQAVTAVQPAAASTGDLPADLVAKLDPAAAAGFTEAASPGAIVGVRTPKGTWIKAYGDSDPTKKVAMTADMHVRIGSVTKPFTGTLIMQLVEQGKVSLDDPISKYVSGVPNGDQVTLKLLGTMRSGVASYSRNPDFVKQLFAKPEGVYTVDQLLTFGYALSPAFAPGRTSSTPTPTPCCWGGSWRRSPGRPSKRRTSR